MHSRTILPSTDMSSKTLSSLLLLLLISLVSLSAASSLIKRIGPSSGDGDGENTCVYTLFIRTGSIWKAGTDSKISVTLIGSDGYGVEITDIEDWGGLMGANYNYFERGNLDLFSGRGPCLPSTPCFLNLTSDGQGDHHGWYCNYVEVSVTGAHMGCAQQKFTVEQWLATDAAPYQLFAVRNYCPSDSQGSRSVHLDRPIEGRKGRVERQDA